MKKEQPTQLTTAMNNKVAILKGNLVKKRDGKKIAESKVKFAAGGC